MAINIHVVYVRPQQVLNGQVINKNDATIAQMTKADLEMRIIEDTSVPNSSDNPTIKEYLEAEAADDYKLSHIDNTMIVTYQT